MSRFFDNIAPGIDFTGFGEIENMASWADVNLFDVPLGKFDMSRLVLSVANIHEKWFARLRKEGPVRYRSEIMCGCDLHQV
jgi:hypothetical protein